MSKEEVVPHLPYVALDNNFIDHVPDGTYNAVYTHHETRTFFGKAQKVVFWFKIIDFGEHFEKRIPRYYNVTRFKGKLGKNGNFVPGRSSDFIREFCRLFSNQINRLDRLPLNLFRDAVVTIKTRTVKEDRKQSKLPDILKYSVVKEITGKGEV